MSDAARIVALLRERGETVATCESLTAGLVAAEFATVPGASEVFRGGLVTYAVDLKTKLAHVDPAWLALRGAFNAETAAQMARGAVLECATSWGVATTGVAGPGPSDGVAAGSVWVGVAGGGAVATQELRLSGCRDEIRRASVEHALLFLWWKLTGRE